MELTQCIDQVNYNIKRNWQGDPCAPQDYVWQGVKCNYQEFESPKIISFEVTKTYNQELVLEWLNRGDSCFYIQSHNDTVFGSIKQQFNRTNSRIFVKIPEFDCPHRDRFDLCRNLEKNKFTGSVPVGLIERKNDVAIWWWSLKRNRQEDAKASPQYGSLESTKRQFTYSEIRKMTNNFERVLGKGGFGTVYHGYMEHSQVAIKMLSASSIQGFQQFRAEAMFVNLLMRVHHKNLTSLVGYCNDETNVGLVYEYLANGNLLNHLSGLTASSILPNFWNSIKYFDLGNRLRIATDAAQGLEYLHYGCKPPIMHRDVKSTNILLNENFQAKISDFGLSRNFPYK
ncbi:Leucine-rich repeat protein kinase family protein [Prunus dulcis]|uniref:Leucine-rich repeat protein kinase family protein n=1 Tax=Prunus dulcis TaxID=3755 RepID=A0A5H2XPM8_PRUDU|nr:Leucine-rich repeat protein kinase family protein [Prunus dulcis]